MVERESDPIVVCGLGAVSAAGSGVALLKAAAWRGEHLYEHLVKSHDSPSTESFGVLMARVPEGAEIEGVPPEALRALQRFDRNCAFAFSAVLQAVTDAGLLRERGALSRCGLIWGSGSSSVQMTQSAMEEILLKGKKRLNPLAVAQAMVSAPCSFTALALGLGGTSFSIGSACASGAHAIQIGAQLVEAGTLDCVVVGGSEQLDVYGCVAAWASSPVMSRTGCWPFEAHRDGTVLGEGAGALVLQRLSRAREQGAPVYAVLRQAVSSTGGTDMVAPSEAAVRQLYELVDFEALRGHDVVFNPHGTATLVGDELEAHIIAETIARYDLNGRLAPTKAATGHALSASGALEGILSVICVHSGDAPGVAREIPFLLDIPPARAGEEGFRPAFAVSNSFGFGGMNCVLVFETAAPHV